MDLRQLKKLHVIVLQGKFQACKIYVLLLSSHRESASCTHISGLLHALVALCPTEIDSTAKLGEDNSSSVQPVPITSLECQWSKPRCRKDSKVEVSNVSFKKHVYGRQRKHELEPINDFDPHPHEYKGTASQKLRCFLEAMKGKDLGVSVMFDENLRIWEEDAEAPEPDKFDLLSNSDLIERVKKFKSTLTVTPEDTSNREGDNRSGPVITVKRYRLTASTFGRIYHMQSTTAPDSFIKQLRQSGVVHSSNSVGEVSGTSSLTALLLLTFR